MYNRFFIILSTIMVAIEGQMNNYPCEIIKSKELKKGKEFLNGSILSDDILYPKEITFSDNGRIFGCICLIKICLQKCCPDHYSVNRNGICFYSDKDIQINKYISLLLNTRTDFIFPSNNVDNHFVAIYQKTNKSLVEQTDLINYHIFNNGSILLKNANNYTLNINNYCLEWYEESQTIMVFLYRNLNEINTLDKMLDFLNIVPYFSKWNYLTLFVTLPFLCITFLTYFFIPELDNLFGKCLMCQVISAIFYFTFQFIFMNMNSEVKGIFHSITESCFFYGYLSNYLWINVLCYALWLTFSKMVPAASNGIVSKEDEKKQFRRYLLYGWGLAFIICAPCRIVRFYILFTSNGNLEIVISRLMVLCFGSVIVLVGFNSVKFISLIWQIYKMSKQRKTLISDVNRHGRQAERNMMFLYFKFFFIMGVIRIPELLLTVCNYTELNIIIVSIIHFMESLMMFVIFICKRRILHAVNYKLCPSLIIFKAEVHYQEPQTSTLSQQRMIVPATTTGSSTISNNE